MHLALDANHSVGGRAIHWSGESVDNFDQTLWKSIQRADENESSMALRPQGWSRATSIDSRVCPFLSQPNTTPSVCELVCFAAPALSVVEADAWIARVNAALPGGYVAHARCDVPPSTHAEKDCDLRRYEVSIVAKMRAPR